jgi:hypothetical protein
MDQTKVILVDQSDNPVREMEKLEAHRNALLHRAVVRAHTAHHHPKSRKDFLNFGLLVFPLRFYKESL